MLKKLILLSLIALPGTASALEPSITVEDPSIAVEFDVVENPSKAVENLSKFQAYKERRAARKALALDTRRALNASKGPHVYRTAIRLHQRFFLPHEEFHVRQPPIVSVVRPVVAVPSPYYY